MPEMKPKTPVGLGKAGKALWGRMVSVFVFAPQELLVLELAARQADDLAELEAALARDGVMVVGSQGQPRLNGAVSEVRQARLALGRLLGLLALPEEGDAKPLTEKGRRAQKAANARWDRKRAVQEVVAGRGSAS